MTLKTFPGGVHPPDSKSLSVNATVEVLEAPEKLYFPVSMHIGAPAIPLVKKGDSVCRGQMIAEAGGFVSAPIHSSVSGTVVGIERKQQAIGRPADMIVIENDGEDRLAEGLGESVDTNTLAPREIVDKIHNAGLVGMGGATFPTHVKLSPPKEKPIDTLILNGVECEPYLTCDDQLMRTEAETILKGARLMARAVGASSIRVGIEANKPEAFKAMSTVAGSDVVVEMLEVKYPQGAEKQLIMALTGRKVPSGGLPMDVGVVVNNVATCYAAYRACALNEPLMRRLVTITGEAIERPANLDVAIGTPISVLTERCGLQNMGRLISGGPMMGLSQFDLSLPVTKGTSGILALPGKAVEPAGPCIRCGRCVEGCPMNLVPSRISLLAESGKNELYEEANALDCIECGVCTYVCPAKRPIVQQVRFVKGELARMMAERKKAKK